MIAAKFMNSNLTAEKTLAYPMKQEKKVPQPGSYVFNRTV